jgi:hypothetical protein
MAVQNRVDNVNKPFILTGDGVTKRATVAQDAGRTADMERNTVMAYDPTNANWVPWTDETATDGTQYPKGILLATLATAEIVAADVEDVPILVGKDITVDQDQLVIENSLTLATIVNIPAGFNTSCEDLLRYTGIWMQDTIDIDDLENT